MQAGLFDALLEMNAANDEMDPGARFAMLGKAARGISQLTRASIAQKKHSNEVRAKLDAAKRKAADQVEAVAKKAGLSEEDFGLIRAQILGIEVAE
jgi:DNA-binding transcriptional regulator YiaG